MKTVTLGPPGEGEGPIKLLEKCGGHYQCPKDEAGNWKGPVVGYAGTYDTPEGKKQWVGRRYVNFAKAERHAPVLNHFANSLHVLLNGTSRELYHLSLQATGFCGAPEGGKALAEKLADLHKSQYIYPEKEVTKAKSESGREVSRLIFDRHEPEEGELWWIVEDVCNNFSTTADLVALIESYGASVTGVLCFLNRSVKVNDRFHVRDGLVLPVVSLVREIIPQYHQDDPEVAADIAAGNVVWKPKKRDEWPKLVAAMAAVQ